jgi:hypothetical protein
MHIAETCKERSKRTCPPLAERAKIVIFEKIDLLRAGAESNERYFRTTNQLINPEVKPNL